MLYRKVYCEDRLPEVAGRYLTSFGELEYDKDRLSFVEWIEEYDEDLGDMGGFRLVHPGYWLEEVKVLTTGERENLS